MIGCPLIRDVSAYKYGKCIPKIALPTCNQQCTPTATVQVSDVPMKCPRGIEIFKDVKVPTQCQCTC